VSDLEVTETWYSERIFYIYAFVFVILLCNVCGFVFLHIYGFFVSLNFLVILDIFRVMHET